MKKSFIVPFLVFVILAGGLFYLFTEFQFNLFRDKVERYDHFTLKNEISTRDYSFGDVIYKGDKIDAKGWAQVSGIIVGIPLVIALLVRFRIKRRQKRKLALMQNETQP